jgi:hypothetical protein
VLVSDVFTMLCSYLVVGLVLSETLQEFTDFLIVNSTVYLVFCFCVAMLLPGAVCLFVLLVTDYLRLIRYIL